MLRTTVFLIFKTLAQIKARHTKTSDFYEENLLQKSFPYTFQDNYMPITVYAL